MVFVGLCILGSHSGGSRFRYPARPGVYCTKAICRCLNKTFKMPKSGHLNMPKSLTLIYSVYEADPWMYTQINCTTNSIVGHKKHQKSVLLCPNPCCAWDVIGEDPRSRRSEYTLNNKIFLILKLF